MHMHMHIFVGLHASDTHEVKASEIPQKKQKQRRTANFRTLSEVSSLDCSMGLRMTPHKETLAMPSQYRHSRKNVHQLGLGKAIHLQRRSQRPSTGEGNNKHI